MDGGGEGDGDGDGDDAVSDDENRVDNDADKLVDTAAVPIVAVGVSTSAAVCTSGVANELVVGGMDDDVGMTVSRPGSADDDEDFKRTCA
jgi:hypothetical protein